MQIRKIKGIVPTIPWKFSEEHCRIIIIGAGGTGGYVIQDLVRYLADPTKHQVVLVDGDAAEEKNLLRQNFIHADLHKNKAQALAERYSAVFGLDISYYPKYIENAGELSHLIYDYRYTNDVDFHPIVISTVDNIKTRKLIENVFETGEPFVWIDAGNEDVWGQVVLSSNRQVSVGPNTNYYLPSIFTVHPEMAEVNDKLPTEMSCAERAVSAPQTIFANRMSANIIMNILTSLLQSQPIDYNEVGFNIQKNQSWSQKLTTENIWRLYGVQQKRSAAGQCTPPQVDLF